MTMDKETEKLALEAFELCNFQTFISEAQMVAHDATIFLAGFARGRASEQERMFPVAGGGKIPWRIAEVAYIAYAQQYGRDQSLERLAERGGFHVDELNALLPDWRTLAATPSASGQQGVEDDSPSVIGPSSPLPTREEVQRIVGERKAVDYVVTVAHAHWLEQIRIHDEEPDYRFKFRTAYGTLAKLGEALVAHELARSMLAASPPARPEDKQEVVGFLVNNGLPGYHIVKRAAQAEEDTGELPGELALNIAVQRGQWPHTMDAAVWADEFAKRFQNSAYDQSGLITWFANAIMAGYDTARQRAAQPSDSVQEVPEECRLIAHNTGDGWALSVERRDDGETVCYLAWPKSWPETIPSSKLVQFGFEIV